MLNHTIKNDKLIAALDLGSNSFHCVIADKTDRHHIYAHKRVPVRLRAGIDVHMKSVSQETSESALAALADFRDLLDHYGITQVRVVGTQAFRLIDPQDAFLQKAQKVLKMPIEILAGEQEAYACYQGVLASLKHTDLKTHLVIDIGGGSTEIVQGWGHCPTQALSLPIGGVELLARCPFEGTPASLNALKALCVEDMAEALKGFKITSLVQCHLASGMAEVFAQLAGERHAWIDRQCLLDLEVALLGGELKPNIVPALSEDRWRLLPAALSILSTCMTGLGIEKITPSHGSVRDALLKSLSEDKDLEGFAWREALQEKGL